jgi:Ca-activated chloride channel family protein
MATNTGGRFFRAKDGEGLRDVYAEIDELEKTERQDVRYTDYEDLYWWLVGPAVALLALELLLARGPYLEFAS